MSLVNLGSLSVLNFSKGTPGNGLSISAQSFEFGALTREGAGAVTVVSSAGSPSFSITAGDTSGHWQINSSTGALSPSATGEDALTGTYNLTVSDGSDSATITITLNANEFSVRSAAESDAAVLASSDGDTIRWRSGLTITGARIDYSGLTPVTSLTIGCDTNRGTTLPGVDLTGSERVTIEGLKINRDWQSGDSTANFVVEAHQTVDCVINDNEIWSTDLSTITPQLNAEVLSGVGCTGGSNATDGLIITNNYIHDVWRPVSAVGPNIVVQSNTFLDCFQNFGEFGNATDLIYKDNRGDGIWANGTDTGNPHSSLLGFSATQITDGILVEGNILVTGSNRFDALADKVGLASGPKFNDTTTDQMFYTNCICRYNAFVPTDSIGLEVSLGSGFNIHHNLIALDPSIYSSASPSLQWHDVGAGSKAWANIAVVMSEGADRGNGVHADMYTDSFDNIVARPVHASFAQSGEAFSYPELFDGPTFTGLTSGQIEAAFTAKTGSRLLTPSLNIGPFGTGYYNFSTGVETAPTYAKPITTTTTGVDLVGVIFDGTNDYATITDATDPLLGMSNDDEFTLLFEIEVDASDDGQDVYLLETAGAGISVRKLATNYIRLRVENAAGETIVEADSSETLTSADGSTVIAISCRMSTYDVRFMKGTNVDGLLKVTEFTGEAYDNDRNSMNIMSATGGSSGRMAGTLSAVYVSDEFIDLHSVSVLNAVVALDGKPDDWGADGSTVTGTQPEFYATGDAAAWNDAGGINLGSDAATAIVTGAVEDVPSGYSPLTVNFDSSDYVTAMNSGSGLTTGNSLIIAMRIVLPVNGSTSLLPILGPTGDSTLYWWDGNSNVIVFRPENTAGGSAVLTTASGYVNQAISIFAKAILRTASTSDAELYIDGSLVQSSYDGSLNGDPSIRDIKMPQYINSNTGSGADVGFDLIGGLWIGNSGFDDLSYSDFFDGSDQPVFNSATIGGHTAVFFQNGDAADWNAGTNDGSDGDFTMNGTVT